MVGQGTADAPSVGFSELEVQTRNGPRRVCVVTPTRDFLLSRERLEKVRRDQRHSELDQALVAYLKRDGGFHALVFRGTNEAGDAHYGLGPDVGPDIEADLLGSLLRAHLRFFREIEPAGVFAMLGVGFRERDQLAYERAADHLALRLAKELETADPQRAAALKLEQWLIERQAIWTATPYEVFVETKLAAALVAAERQRRVLRQLAPDAR
ncbi:MAG: hypothetical protein AAF721_01985 [Myxococcota bacterium]